MRLYFRRQGSCQKHGVTRSRISSFPFDPRDVSNLSNLSSALLQCVKTAKGWVTLERTSGFQESPDTNTTRNSKLEIDQLLSVNLDLHFVIGFICQWLGLVFSAPLLLYNCASFIQAFTGVSYSRFSFTSAKMVSK